MELTETTLNKISSCNRPHQLEKNSDYVSVVDIKRQVNAVNNYEI